MFERASNLYDSLNGQLPESLSLELDCVRPRVIVRGFESDEFDSLSLSCRDENTVWGALLKNNSMQFVQGYDLDTKDFMSLGGIIAEIDYLFFI